MKISNISFLFFKDLQLHVCSYFEVTGNKSERLPLETMATPKNQKTDLDLFSRSISSKSNFL